VLPVTPILPAGPATPVAPTGPVLPVAPGPVPVALMTTLAGLFVIVMLLPATRLDTALPNNISKLSLTLLKPAYIESLLAASLGKPTFICIFPGIDITNSYVMYLSLFQGKEWS
jgi:hypothetical protein